MFEKMVAFLARRYAEVASVMRGGAAAGGERAPEHFVWRGRHYTVRAVLAHWVRTGAWWERSAAALLMLGEPGSGSGDEVDDDEREFFRVEAAIGRSGIPVVLELCCVISTSTWTVRAVMD